MYYTEQYLKLHMKLHEIHIVHKRSWIILHILKVFDEYLCLFGKYIRTKGNLAHILFCGMVDFSCLGRESLVLLRRFQPRNVFQQKPVWLSIKHCMGGVLFPLLN